MADSIHKLAFTHERTCPICGAVSQRTTLDARMDSIPDPPRIDDGKVSYDIEWTVINGWLDCGHQIIRDGAVVQDWAPLPEDVTTHVMADFIVHATDGRACEHHSRLDKWTFEGTKECLREHRRPRTVLLGGDVPVESPC